MFQVFESFLSRDQVAQLRAALVPDLFVLGDSTAHGLARAVKDNRQISVDHPVGLQCAKLVNIALNTNPHFRQFALPTRVTPPMFSMYKKGMKYGRHSDAALMDGGGVAMRSDYSMTIFLSDPTEYEGGELEFPLGHNVPLTAKLPAGHAVLYPSDTLHEVRPVLNGTRMACVLWVQSAVAEAPVRGLLHDLDRIRFSMDNGRADEAKERLVLVKENLTRLFARP